MSHSTQQNKDTQRGLPRLAWALFMVLVGAAAGAHFLPDLGRQVMAEKRSPARLAGEGETHGAEGKDKPKTEPVRSSDQVPVQENDPDIALAMRLERGFEKVAQRVAPSVVNLTVFSRNARWREQLWRMHEKPGARFPDREFTGSGVLLRKDGTILTNEHVVRDANHIRARLHDGFIFKAKVVSTDPRSDLAVLRPVEGTVFKSKLTPATLADSDQVRVGQWAVAVGNPFKLTNTVTVGVVSARSRSLSSTHRFFSDVFYGDLIQTDAAINPGNSGGPLFNIRGQLIGINTMIYSRSGTFEGFGFAIPSNQVKPRLAALEAGREVMYGWLGVSLKNLNSTHPVFDLPDGKGVLIEEVFADMPADRAGLRRGSVIVSFDKTRVKSVDELIMVVGMAQVGKIVSVRILNPRGVMEDVPVRIGLRSPSLVSSGPHSFEGAREETPVAGEWSWRGMRLKELSDEDAQKAGGPIRVIGVKKGTQADRAGLFEGAVIDEIKTRKEAAIQPLRSLEALKRIGEGTKGAVYLHASVVGYIELDGAESPDSSSP